jgi:hypothetical protein
MMFAKELTQTGHTRRFTVDTTPDGWEVRIEEDSAVVTCSRFSDWHRVERALNSISEQVDQLKEGGWCETAPSC